MPDQNSFQKLCNNYLLGDLFTSYSATLAPMGTKKKYDLSCPTLHELAIYVNWHIKVIKSSTWEHLISQKEK